MINSGILEVTGLLQANIPWTNKHNTSARLAEPRLHTDPVAPAVRLLCLWRRFLNQLLTCVVVRPVAAASSCLSRVDGYGVVWYQSRRILLDFS